MNILTKFIIYISVDGRWRFYTFLSNFYYKNSMYSKTTEPLVRSLKSFARIFLYFKFWPYGGTFQAKKNDFDSFLTIALPSHRIRNLKDIKNSCTRVKCANIVCTLVVSRTEKFKLHFSQNFLFDIGASRP